MAPSPLLHTKFLVPPLGEHLPRPHLIRWLERQTGRRLILVSAPAGYGKTTLLADFVNGLTRPVAWVQLDTTDSDPTVFLSILIEAIRRSRCTPRRFARIGRNAQALLDHAEGSADSHRALTVLINELGEAVLDSLTIVFEDYQYIANPVTHHLVDLLLENAPASVQLIVSTRMDPPLPLGRLRSRGLLAELRSADLRFRDDEIAALLSAGSAGISAESLSLLSQKTEGWIAALQIIRNSLAVNDGRPANEIIRSLSGSNRFIFQYLVEEVFQRQPSDLQEFMLCTAVLSQMDAASCNAIGRIRNAQSLLQSLERQNLFLSGLDAEGKWYRYHFLFREFLLNRLQQEHGDQIPALEGRAGEYYEAQGEKEAAFGHYVEAGDYESAARTASAFAADLVERGRVEVLNRYVKMLPADALRRYPQLLLQHGNAHRRLGEVGLAVAAYEDARSAFVAQSNVSGASRALTRLAEVYRAQGDYLQAERLAGEALAIAPEEDHSARAEALMALAKSTGFLSGMDRGQELAEQAVAESRVADDLSVMARAAFLQSLGQICWWHGDPQAAGQYAQEALRLCPDEPSPIAAQAYILLVTPHLYWREFGAALQDAERGLEIAQTLHLNELLPAAYTALGNVLTRLGETARAEAVLRQSVDLAQHLGMASYEQLMATGYLAYNLCGQGRVDEAWQLAEGSLWAYTGNPDAYEAFVCRSVLADIALEKGQLGRAENLFTELLQVGERRQFRIPLAMVHFGLAYIHLVTRRKATGLEHACASLELIEPTRAFQLFIDQMERSRIVCNALVESGRDSPFVQRVLENLPGKKLKRPSSLAPRPDVRIQSLGTFRVFAAGEEISQDRWVSTKARDLLGYFLTFRAEHIAADRAFDAIWPDKAGRGLTAYHTALSRLRAALRIGENSPRLILLEAGEYWLDVARFTIDVDEFDSALAAARVATDEQAAARLQDAISLYHGEYLQNLYYDWLLPERRRLTQAYLEALRSLAQFHYAHERFTRSLELLDRALRVDNLQEDLHCQAMRVHAALGDRAGLVQQYQEMKQALMWELDLEPLPATERLYQDLLTRLQS